MDSNAAKYRRGTWIADERPSEDRSGRDAEGSGKNISILWGRNWTFLPRQASLLVVALALVKCNYPKLLLWRCEDVFFWGFIVWCL